MEVPTVHFDLDHDLTLCILAAGDTADRVFDELRFDADQPLQCPENGIDRTVASRCVAEDFVAAVASHFERGCGQDVGSGERVEAVQRPLILRLADVVFDQSDDVRVVDLFLLVGQGDEFVKHLLNQ